MRDATLKRQAYAEGSVMTHRVKQILRLDDLCVCLYHTTQVDWAGTNHAWGHGLVHKVYRILIPGRVGKQAAHWP